MEPFFLGEIRAFGGNFAPRGWALCDGQLLPINQNDALFSILGTIYGGDGRTTFGLPDLRGRAALHAGQGPGLSNRRQGERAGSEAVTLNSTELPGHNHPASVTIHCNNTVNAPDSIDPEGKYLGDVPGTANNHLYADAPETGKYMAPQSLNLPNTGNSQPHNNMQPYLAINYCIALQGMYPSRP